MSRNDDFDDIPELGPARDDFDSAPEQPAKKSVDPPAPKASKSQPAPQPKRGVGGGVYAVLLLLIVALGGFGYWSYQQQRLLADQLQQVETGLTQTLGRVSDLENLISATDESASKSGAALQARLNKVTAEQSERIKHVDSEIAKLWTVAYQRNKPQIEALEKSLKGLNEETAALEKQLGGQLAALQSASQERGSALSGLQEKLDTNQEDLRSLGGSLQTLSTELNQLEARMRQQDLANQELDELQEQQLQNLENQLQRLQRQPAVPAQLSQQVQEQQQALESINAYRLQVNQELLRLRERVNQLQLQVQQ